jgi:hypothetical protein
MSFVPAFAEVEVTSRRAPTSHRFPVRRGRRHRDPPAGLGGQILGRSILGIGHAIGQKWVYDQQYGVALARRFYQNKPPTILDVPRNMEWAAVELPDPETPVGARGYRRAAGRVWLFGGAERDLGGGGRPAHGPCARERRRHSRVARSGPKHDSPADRERVEPLDRVPAFQFLFRVPVPRFRVRSRFLGSGRF